MAVIVKQQLTEDELAAAFVLLDPLFFALTFWAEDLTIPESRMDLPLAWRGQQVISLEQRLMFYDGVIHLLYRDALPEMAAQSSQRVALRTSRKIGKTLSIEALLLQVALTKTAPGIQEGMFHAPRENHMAPVRSRIEKKLDTVPLFRLMRVGFDRENGILSFKSGWVWHFRIEGGCVHGDTRIADAETGEMFAVRDMLDGPRPRLIHTVNAETYELTTTADYDVVASGVQELFEVTTEDMWSVKATANHPFLTPTGWRRLDQLQPGDLVAAVGRLSAQGCPGISGDQARLLGYFVGDGCTTGTLPLFTNNDLGVVADWRALCEQFPNIEVKELQEFQYSAAGKLGANHSALIALLREHGVWGKRADAKRVPRAVWQAEPKVVAEFLAGLIACDGSVALKANGGIVISFASINRGLVEDVAYLLLRFGIKTRLEHRLADDARVFGGRTAKSKELWSLRLAGVSDLTRFCKHIHLRGRKGERQEYVLGELAGRIEGGHGLAIPSIIVDRARQRIAGMTWGKLNRLACTSYHTGDTGVRYTSVRAMNTVLQSEALDNLLARDVVWVGIKSIAPCGCEPTYDLSVPGTHSFVGNQQILHNSKTGTNMVGLRATVMFGDEADYSQEAAHIERDQTALPGCAQRWGGVPRGVRGIFWRVCSDKTGRGGWSIQRHDMRANPLYHSESAWTGQIGEDGYHSQRVQTQVLGRDGEEAISSFPVIPVDITAPYVHRILGSTEYNLNADNLKQWLQVPIQAVQADGWMLHMDYGYAPSPTELGISYLRFGTWHVLARFEIMRLDVVPTANLLHGINTQILPQPANLIVVDAHGQGRGVLSTLHSDPRWTSMDYPDKALAVGFEGTTQIDGVWAHKKCKSVVRQENRDGMWICDSCQTRIFDEKELTRATLSTKVFLTDVLKEAFANGQRVLDSEYTQWPAGAAVVLGVDPHLTDELTGTTEVKTQGGATRYTTPGGADHLTDMLRCLVSGATRYAALQGGDYDVFESDFGWGGEVAAGNWTAPWANQEHATYTL